MPKCVICGCDVPQSPLLDNIELTLKMKTVRICENCLERIAEKLPYPALDITLLLNTS